MGKIQTNADYIRSMSDEELAAYILNFKNTYGEEYEGESSSLDWLQEEKGNTGRLTVRSENSGMVWFKDTENNDMWCEPCEMSVHNVRMALAKLADYEDADEQGLLLRLPCKPRSEVFLICNRYTHCSFEDVSFEESSCEGCEYDCDSRKELYIHRNSSVDIEWITRNLNKFGKTVFLTESEAEAKLKEMEEK